MKKFTRSPIGLGFTYSEHEDSAAYIWNDLVDNNLPLDSWWKPASSTYRDIMFRKDGTTMLSLGIIEQDGDLFRLSDWAIGKIKKYFETHY